MPTVKEDLAQLGTLAPWIEATAQAAEILITDQESRLMMAQARIAELEAAMPRPAPWEGYTKPTLHVEPLTVPLGTTELWLRLEARGEIKHALRAYFEIRNGRGTNVGDAARQARIVPLDYATWWPDEDQRVTYALFDLSHLMGSGAGDMDGDSLSIIVHPRGFASESGVAVRVTFSSAAPPHTRPDPLPQPRKPRELNIISAPVFHMDPATAQMSASGRLPNGLPCLKWQFPHGMEQSGNDEPTIYLPGDHPETALHLTRDEEGIPVLRITPRRLSAPIKGRSGRVYHWAAGVVTTQHIPEANGRFGLWDRITREPARVGCWSGDWWIGRDIGPDDPDLPETAFPGEQDGGEFNIPWQMTRRMISCGQHWGLWGSGLRKGSDTRIIDLARCGVGFPLNLDVTATYLRRSMVVTPPDAGSSTGWVVHFVNGIEVHCYQNLAVHEKGREGWGYMWQADNTLDRTFIPRGYDQAWDDSPDHANFDVREFKRYEWATGFEMLAG